MSLSECLTFGGPLNDGCSTVDTEDHKGRLPLAAIVGPHICIPILQETNNSREKLVSWLDSLSVLHAYTHGTVECTEPPVCVRGMRNTPEGYRPEPEDIVECP